MLQKEFRYHPLVEGLKVNEDGTEVIYNGVSLPIKVQRLAHCVKERRLVNLGLKQKTIIRLICECWHGAAPSIEHAARRHDEWKGDHYTNLYWGKSGMNRSSAKYTNVKKRSLTDEQFLEIEERRKSEKLKDIVKDYEVSEMAYYRHKKRYYGKKENE